MIKKLLMSKWLKIVLAGALVIAIAIVFLAYRAQEEATEDVSTNPITEGVNPKETLLEEILPEETAFLEAVEALKLQVNAANAITQFPEKSYAITDIEDKLKEILASDYAELLTNETFTSDEFSVNILDYPLHNGTIRRIQYTMQYTIKHNDDDIPRTDTRFFLQYIGKTTFFSDLISTDIIDENEFQVFENTDDCFVFLTSSNNDNEYATFNSDEKIMDYYATIYIPKENEFYVKQRVEIPMKISSERGRSFKLIQQDNDIKGLAYYYQSELGYCIFNSSELIFERPEGIMESEPVDYDMPGLLLGLSDENGNIRTLFIRKEGDKVCADEYAGQIIIPRANKLFSVRRSIWYEDLYTDGLKDGSTYQYGNIDIKKLIYSPLGDLTDNFNKTFKSEPLWGYYAVTDIPLYVGEDYICYIQKSYETGGGTFHAGSSDIRFDKLDNLANFTLDDWLSPNFKETTLADLIYGKKAEDLYKSNVTTYGGKLQPYIDFKQLSIKRNLGKWSFMLPIAEEYYHPGNGSYYKNITAFAAYDNDVPNFLATGDEVIELGGWRNWDAKDIFRFPESKAALAQYDYSIEIYCDDNNFEDYDLSIPVNFDEYIVSINFADSNIQKAWISELSKINE